MRRVITPPPPSTPTTSTGRSTTTAGHRAGRRRSPPPSFMLHSAAEFPPLDLANATDAFDTDRAPSAGTDARQPSFPSVPPQLKMMAASIGRGAKRCVTLSADAILLTVAAPFFAIWQLYRLAVRLQKRRADQQATDDI